MVGDPAGGQRLAASQGPNPDAWRLADQPTVFPPGVLPDTMQSSNLWVPRISSASRHQPVLVDEATKPIGSRNPPDGACRSLFGRGRSRGSGLTERPMWAVSVVVIHELLEDRDEVTST